MGNWATSSTLDDDVRLFNVAPTFDLYASYIVFLLAHILELFASNPSRVEYTHRWKKLFSYLENWYTDRPPELRSILELTPSETDFSRPFPIILFSNAPAISGTQLYHTAALLMLQKKPVGTLVGIQPRSMLWHARRIISISISNTHHGCWTNCVQPLWIAGKLMSHPAEHRAILETYDRIEKETGWGANWRAEDLKKHWGLLESE